MDSASLCAYVCKFEHIQGRVQRIGSYADTLNCKQFEGNNSNSNEKKIKNCLLIGWGGMLL
ncbi:glutathione peroxidase [Paenibacillus popilliae ATCC 14706]|uniref:Glutathione peroxidase n=1 Tax=Paenibacillus popilliae ATCC 14706 TaxID=1212764 RepID=M9LQL8_PAEPP|nr:glutathione peroxidase [Paenibacillus popilliae ATCC 14706]